MGEVEHFPIYLWTNQSFLVNTAYHLPTGLFVFFFSDLFLTPDL